jgi:hypothetical protein
LTTDITALLSAAEVSPRPLRGLSLYVEDTATVRGRGVFASRRFRRNDLIEVAPVIVINSGTVPKPISHVLYEWERWQDGTTTRAVALGYGSIYNHGNPANLRYAKDPAGRVIRYWALRDIAADEELTINYNSMTGLCAPEQETWFERHGVKRSARST